MRLPSIRARAVERAACVLVAFTVQALALVDPTAAQSSDEDPAPPTFASARAKSEQQLTESLRELSTLRGAIAAERVPMGEELSALEVELLDVRQEYQRLARLLDGRTQDLGNLRIELKQRSDEAAFLSTQLAEYGRNFESRLHITELQRYADVLEAARVAPESASLSERQVFEAQLHVVDTAFGRIEDALGGTRFAGRAIDGKGLVNEGDIVLVGPVAVFRSRSGETVGTAEQRMSTQPVIVGFADRETTAAAARLVADGAGALPLDATLGNAHKVEATNETFVEGVKKGGPIMIPIFVMAGAALLVAAFKWLSFTLIRRPARKSVNALLEAVARHDEPMAQRLGSGMSEKGPMGRMLWSGVQHMNEPRDLVEEAMFESVLTTKHRLQSFLPFVAICAASAPLLGLLGTVTGIINTFKMIELFGAGDVKSLSGGISEALITTKWGLIVAIPSLLLHAFLARKARGVTAGMEAAAVAFVNRLSKDGEDAPQPRTAALGATSGAAAPDADLVRAEVTKLLGELLGSPEAGPARRRGAAAQHS